MTDERLNELLDDASRTYRVPPEPDLAAMWSHIEREAFAERPARRWPMPSWRTFSVGMAAALVLGVALGRVSPRAISDDAAVAAGSPVAVPAQRGVYDRAASELLGKTVVLLTTLPIETENGRAAERFTSQAVELLTTTRLLLDSPAASDRRFEELLEDLELVLVQIASLRSGRNEQEIELITDALEERDVVPRIRLAVARLSLGDD